MATTASLSAVAARPLSVAGLKKPLGASFQPVPRARPAAAASMAVRASASMKERATAGLTAAAMAAAMVLPDVAEAAQGSLTPSLKNFLLSIVSGGVVLVAIVGAVVAVSNFDPVKRT
uniref:Photosystem II reaction center X protein n=1 Tax=Oryza glumipatula TaxID=40148 RepID=A0A0E0AP69_9ORYZ